MSGTFPTTVNPSQISNFRSVESTFHNRSMNGASQARRIGGQYWAFTLVYNRMSREVKQELYAFVMKQKGRYGTFQVVLPDRAIPLGVATGTPKVNLPVAAGQDEVLIDGFTEGVTGIMKADDLLKFSGHTKVYSFVEDVTSGIGNITLEDGTGILLLETGDDILLEIEGQVTATIKPELVEAVADDEAVTVIDVPFTVAMENPVQGYSVGSPVEYDAEFDMVEER